MVPPSTPRPATPGPSSQQTPNRSQSHPPFSPKREREDSHAPTTIPKELEEAEPEIRVSFYVQAIDDMIEAIRGKEEHLFSELENLALKRFQELDYQPRYLFARLYLRKRGNWFRSSSILESYEEDIKDLESTLDSLWEKDVRFIHGKKDVKMKGNDNNDGSIDLTESDSEDEGQGEGGGEEEEEEGVDYSIFAFNQNDLKAQGTKYVLSWLALDELKLLAKKLGIASPKGSSTVDAWIEALMKTSKQSTLSFAPISQTKDVSIGVEFQKDGKKSTQQALVLDGALKMLGDCIQLNPSYTTLLDRLSLIYHRRSTSSSGTTALTSSLLARFGKRVYPSYKVKRSFNLFETRKDLRDYEKALEVERRMEEYLGEGWGWSSGSGNETGVKIEEGEEQTPQKKKAKSKQGQSITSLARSQAAAKVAEDKKKERERIWKEGIDLYENEIKAVWNQMVKKEKIKKGEEEGEDRLIYYKKRFLPVWPLTRAVYKASSIYARLGNHSEELIILRSLLRQTTFHRGKRGIWWDRLALLYMHYPAEEESDLVASRNKNERARGEKMKRERLECAFACCEKGLEDKWTHVVYRAALERRRARLENLLDTPQAERKKVEKVLHKSEIRIMEGERLDEGKVGKHSIWKSTNEVADGDEAEEVSVELFALEGYVAEGWKGFHSENSILSMIFALLFWDILFADVDGVFETAYQSAPLDLTTDSFAIVRADLIEARCNEIAAGKAKKILRKVDDTERPRGTFCAGCHWDKYPRKALCEIVECIDGKALSELMLVYAEEYSHRSGGLPDLILWNYEDKELMFSEVKGPGDTLSSSQKVWIDLLLRLGIRVEVCKVLTEELIELEEEKTKKRKKANEERKRKKKEEVDGEGSDEEIEE